MAHPDTPADLRLVIRCLLCGLAGKIRDHLAGEDGYEPTPQMIRDIYPHGRLVFEKAKETFDLTLRAIDEAAPNVLDDIEAAAESAGADDAWPEILDAEGGANNG